MLTAKNTLEIKIGERIYHFICNLDAPIGEIHDVLCQMKSFVVAQINIADKNPPSPAPEVQTSEANNANA